MALTWSAISREGRRTMPDFFSSLPCSSLSSKHRLDASKIIETATIRTLSALAIGGVFLPLWFHCCNLV
jgi:hypothetical protein